MDWIAHNPVADMRGPAFLAFYLVVIAATALVCWLTRRALDWTGGMQPPAVPHEPDPHEIAYLRGGEREVANSVVFTLIQKGLLEAREEGGECLVGPAAARAARRSLSPIERRTLDWFAAPQSLSRVLGGEGIAPHLKPFCAAYEQKLQRESLLTSPATQQTARLLRWSAALVILALGFYKLAVALSRGRFNVIFLVLMAVVGVVLVFRVTKLPRLTGRGRAYLERLRLAFEWLKARPAVAQQAPRAAEAYNPAGAGGPVFAGDMTLPLMVGLFGAGALAGTQYDYYQQQARRAGYGNGTSADGGSWSDSSGDSSDSSSGGSGSDGGSSCGGSSCGGGGCGGCGS